MFWPGTLLCENYEADVNKTAIGWFKCPFPFEPNSYTLCCGDRYAEFCCKPDYGWVAWWHIRNTSKKIYTKLDDAMGLLPDTQNCGSRMVRECRECFPRHQLQRKPLVSDPGMHYGMCVTHMPWCMSGLLNRGGWQNVPGACATRNVEYLVRGPWYGNDVCFIGFCQSKPSITRWIPLHTVIKGFDVFFGASLHKLLNKQSALWWFEMPYTRWNPCDAMVCDLWFFLLWFGYGGWRHMNVMASPITGKSSVCVTVCLG